MTALEGSALHALLARDTIPPAFERWRVSLPPGAARPTRAEEWAGAVVLIQRGTLEVECTRGGSRIFTAGNLLALGWLPLRMLHNRGADGVELLAVRRRGPPSTDEFLHVVHTVPIAPSPLDPQGALAMKFRTTIQATGANTTGVPVPEDVLAALGAGKRPAVRITVARHTYRGSIGTVDGAPMVSLSAENRAAAGVAAGDEVDVELALDTEPREVVVPDDFAAALDADPQARATFDGLSYSNRRFHVESITGARSDETRRRRIEKSLAALREGRPR